MSKLVLLPGLACDGALFAGVSDALAPWRPQVADVHTRCASLPEMAQALLAEHDGPLLLAGVSMGGMLALEAARQAPQRIAGLALLGTTARADTPELLRLRGDAIGLFEQGRAEEVLRANVMFAFHPRHHGERALIDGYLRMVLRAGADQLVAQNRAVMARADLRPALPGIGCPALVLCGEADALTPPEHAQEIAAGLPNARLELIEAAGHMLTLEQPARVGALLADWLRATAAR
jgi:pimeloyl-ACP methyl ester carboxylesterase